MWEMLCKRLNGSFEEMKSIIEEIKEYETKCMHFHKMGVFVEDTRIENEQLKNAVRVYQLFFLLFMKTGGNYET